MRRLVIGYHNSAAQSVVSSFSDLLRSILVESVTDGRVQRSISAGLVF